MKIAQPQTTNAPAKEGEQIIVRYCPGAAEAEGFFHKASGYALAGICYAAILILLWVANACISFVTQLDTMRWPRRRHEHSWN
jgi:hypothetical protein